MRRVKARQHFWNTSSFNLTGLRSCMNHSIERTSNGLQGDMENIKPM